MRVRPCGRDGSGDQAQLFWRVFGPIDDEPFRQLARPERRRRNTRAHKPRQAALVVWKGRMAVAATVMMMAGGEGSGRRLDSSFGRDLHGVTLCLGMVVTDFVAVFQRRVRHIVA